MEFKSIRRVVVGHDPQGKAVAAFDGNVAPTQRTPGGNAVANLWITGEFPIDPNGAADKAQTKVGVPPPAGGTIFRIVDFPPASGGTAPSHVDHEKILLGMGIDPATQGYMRHRNTHRTRSVDYAIVLDGEIDMLMDDAEVHLKVGRPVTTVVIPVSTLLFRKEGLRVATVEHTAGGDIAKLVPITIGHDDGDTVQVISGLDANTPIISNPPDSVIDGEKVHVLQASSNGKQEKTQ